MDLKRRIEIPQNLHTILIKSTFLNFGIGYLGSFQTFSCIAFFLRYAGFSNGMPYAYNIWLIDMQLFGINRPYHHI